MCREDPSLAEDLGCEKPRETAIWDDLEDKYCSCPRLWLSTATRNFFRSVRFAKEFGGLKYEEMSNRWMEAWQYMESANADLMVLVRPPH